MEVLHPRALAQFRPDKMGKVDLASSERLMCGLNCFEPGQVHKPHAHSGTDKLYYVLEGRGEFSLGEATQRMEAGDLLHVPEGREHGVRNTGEARLVVLIVMAPNPLH